MSWPIGIGFVVNSFAAVRDVAVDGMTIDVLPASERARANALMAFGQVAGCSSFAAEAHGKRRSPLRSCVRAMSASAGPYMTYVATIAVVLGLGNQMLFVAFIALAMNMCSPRVAATQFAVYMSVANLSRSVGAAAYSYVAIQLHYAGAFTLVGALMVGAAIALGFFNLNSHQTRLSIIDPPREALGT